MSIRQAVQDAIKDAMKSKNQARLECLRMAKGALLLVEKAGAKDVELTDDEAAAALRAEVKKRQSSIETYRELNKPDEVAGLEVEISILNEFLPKQLGEADLEAKIRAFLAEHPDMNHAGKLTGAMKKELGDLADSRLLNEICKKIVG
ncbi:MAG: GatB/YqeY domain-containing protein [Candidatus Hydrogenedentes bacterium]|nr:GatB/YqeY domain-containing protein [Candidatus Hydrogenedentota bacterium]